jgi:hypothetical protein
MPDDIIASDAEPSIMAYWAVYDALVELNNTLDQATKEQVHDERSLPLPDRIQTIYRTATPVVGSASLRQGDYLRSLAALAETIATGLRNVAESLPEQHT